MAETLKYPFRFSRGRAEKVTVGSNEHAAQVITAAMLTGKGEMFLSPTFGSRSAAFSAIDIPGLMFTLSNFYPDITVDSILQDTDGSTGKVLVRVNFS